MQKELSQVDNLNFKEKLVIDNFREHKRILNQEITSTNEILEKTLSAQLSADEELSDTKRYLKGLQNEIGSLVDSIKKQKINSIRREANINNREIQLKNREEEIDNIKRELDDILYSRKTTREAIIDREINAKKKTLSKIDSEIDEKKRTLNEISLKRQNVEDVFSSTTKEKNKLESEIYKNKQEHDNKKRSFKKEQDKFLQDLEELSNEVNESRKRIELPDLMLKERTAITEQKEEDVLILINRIRNIYRERFPDARINI